MSSNKQLALHVIVSLLIGYCLCHLSSKLSLEKRVSKKLILSIVVLLLISYGIYLYWKSSHLAMLKVPFSKQQKLNYGFHPSPNYTKFVQVGITPKTIEKIHQKAKSCMLSISFNPVSLPENFSWGNVQKHNLYPNLPTGDYLCSVRNQHAPVYLGVCWLLASLLSLGERFNIMHALKYGEQRAPLILAPQQIIDCSGDDVDMLTGGDAEKVYNFIFKNYIVDETCKPLQSSKHANQCQPDCYNCLAIGQTECSEIGSSSTTPVWMDERGHGCCKIDNPTKYYIEGYSNITNRYKELVKQQLLPIGMSYTDYIKHEIYVAGPVTIAICAGDELELADGKTIISFPDNNPAHINHLVSIVGWGIENNIPYWIIRNTWGTNYANGGYVKVRNDNNSLGLNDMQNNPIYGAYPLGWSEVTKSDISNEVFTAKMFTMKPIL
jgi:cathepsin X